MPQNERRTMHDDDDAKDQRDRRPPLGERGDRLSLISSSTSFRGHVCLASASRELNAWARMVGRAMGREHCLATLGIFVGCLRWPGSSLTPPKPGLRARGGCWQRRTENGDEACQGEKCLVWDFGTYFLPPSAFAHTSSHCCEVAWHVPGLGHGPTGT